MHKEVEFKGTWYSPDKQEDILTGTFFYTRNEGCILEVIGANQDFFAALSSNEMSEVILGTTVENEKITLLGCLRSSQRVNMDGIAIIRYSAHFAFIGNHFSSLNDLYFDTINISICDIEDWIGIYGFDVLEIQREKRKISIEYQQPTNCLFNIRPDLNVFFEFNCNFSQNRNIAKAEIIQTTLIGINTPNLLPFKKILNLSSRLYKFLSIAYYDTPHVKNVYLTNSSIINQRTGKSDVYEILYSDNYFNERYKEGLRIHKFLFSYTDVQINFTNILKKWFDLYDKAGSAINLMVELLLKRGFPLEMKFLTAIQAVETFHRNIFGGKDLPDNEHEKRLNEIYKIVPEQHIKWLKEKLNYSNELGLRKRILNLIDDIPDVITQKIIKEKKPFINAVVNTRNYFTHYDKGLKASVLVGGELLRAIDKLKILLLCSILNELGLSRDQIIKMVILDKVYGFYD